MEICNNQPNDGVGGGGGIGDWRGDANGWNAWGRTCTHRFGRQTEWQINKNREGDGALQFDGSCWMGGRNN
jgi:hypothetical protein